MKKLSTFLSVFFITISAISQNWELNFSTPSTSEEIKVLSAPNDNVCWFITNFDNLYKTNDGGVNWVTIGPTSTSFNPAGLFVFNEDIAFKTSNQSLFRTINGGQSWSQVFIGTSGFAPVIRMLDETNGVMSSGGNLYKTINGGASWSMADITQPPASILNTSGKGSIYNLAEELWVTQSSTGVAYSSDFGQSWTTPENNGFTFFNTNAHIAFSHTNFGICIEGSVSPFVYVTTDGGNNWEITDDSMGANIDVAVDDNDLWYIPNPADHFYLKHSGDAGATWEIEIQLEGGHGFLTLEKSRSGHRLWAGTTKGKLYTYAPKLSVEENSVSEVKIFPNPTTSEIWIQHNFTGSVAIELYDLSGKEIQTWKYETLPSLESLKLSLNSTASGIYFLKIQSGKNLITKKLVVK